MDPLVRLFREKPETLEFLGRVWEILYLEGSSPDIGKRRENFIRTLLEKEFGLKVIPAPSMEREWDFKVIIKGEERTYSLKTAESIATVKVAWNGFPSIERARRFEFKYPIIYVIGNRRQRVIAIYVFDVEDLESLKEEMGDDMWWIPRKGTNPRGFGINKRAIERLMEKAEAKGNYALKSYSYIDINSIRKEYWEGWYNLLRRLAFEG